MIPVLLQIHWIRIGSLSSSIAYLRRREWFSYIWTQFLISEGSRNIQGTLGQAIQSGKEKWLVSLSSLFLVVTPWCHSNRWWALMWIFDAYGLLIRGLSDKTRSSCYWVTFSQQIRCVDRPLLRKGLQWLLFDLGSFLLWYDTFDHSLHCRFILSSPRYDQWNGVKGTKYLDSIPRLERHWSERREVHGMNWLTVYSSRIMSGQYDRRRLESPWAWRCSSIRERNREYSLYSFPSLHLSSLSHLESQEQRGKECRFSPLVPLSLSHALPLLLFPSLPLTSPSNLSAFHLFWLLDGLSCPSVHLFSSSFLQLGMHSGWIDHRGSSSSSSSSPIYGYSHPHYEYGLLIPPIPPPPRIPYHGVHSKSYQPVYDNVKYAPSSSPLLAYSTPSSRHPPSHHYHHHHPHHPPPPQYHHHPSLSIRSRRNSPLDARVNDARLQSYFYERRDDSEVGVPSPDYSPPLSSSQRWIPPISSGHTLLLSIPSHDEQFTSYRSKSHRAPSPPPLSLRDEYEKSLLSSLKSLPPPLPARPPSKDRINRYTKGDQPGIHPLLGPSLVL